MYGRFPWHHHSEEKAKVDELRGLPGWVMRQCSHQRRLVACCYRDVHGWNFKGWTFHLLSA